jgi:adenylate cyclase
LTPNARVTGRRRAQRGGNRTATLFGAPLAQEGHALLACEAALSMQDAFPPDEGGLRLRVGLHSGEVVSEVPAGEPSTERGAHGSTIHLASRLQQLATKEQRALQIKQEVYNAVDQDDLIRNG